MKYMNIMVLILTLLLTLGTVVSAGEEKQAAKNPVPTIATEGQASGVAKEKRFIAVMASDGVQRVQITGGEYFFDPNYIVVRVNVPVEFKVKKESGYTPHDIVVTAPEAGINFSESLGKESKVITFTPKKIGKYEIYCSKKLPFAKSHKDRGMDGIIEVVQ